MLRLEVLRRERRSGHYWNAPELLQGQEVSITGHDYLGFASCSGFNHQIVCRVCLDRLDALGRIGYVFRPVDPRQNLRQERMAGDQTELRIPKNSREFP